MKFQIFWKISDFLKNFRFSEKISDFRKKIQILGKNLPFESHPGGKWPLRHLIRVMRRQDMTKKITKTNTKTKNMTKTKTFREHPQRAVLETCDLWYIWSEWWAAMTWPTKIQWQRQIQWQIQRQRQRQWHIYIWEQPQRALETCDLRLDTWDTDFISDNWEQQY